MAAPDERAFVTFPRGYVRDNVILAHFRNQLRTKANPVTGQTFTEDEIQRATAPGTRFYIEADSIDLLGQAQQARALYLAAQADPRRSNTAYLEQVHAQLWLGDDPRLKATGASGSARATGVNGTVIPGSTTVGDPAAAIATDPNGLRFQVLQSVTIANKEAVVTLLGLDTGFVTRLDTGTELKWSANVNPGTDPSVIALEPFDGGFDQETDQELADRVVQRMRYRPASGNSAHFQAWAKEASAGVEQAFVYACALQAGSTVISVLEKRAPILTQDQLPEGPNARIPSVATLTLVNDYLVTPSSPVVPERVFTLVTGVQPQPSDLVLRLGLTKGKNGGWKDPIPWPTYSAQNPQLAVSAVTDALHFAVTTDQSLPNASTTLVGADAPSLILFNQETSRWVSLDVLSVTDTAPGTGGLRAFNVVLNAAPILYDANLNPRTGVAIHVGDRLSPATDRAQGIAQALEAYFDSLGPGEALDANAVNFARAARQPRPSVSYPQRAGQALINYLGTAIGAVDAEATIVTRNDPDVPTNIVDGPNMITLGATNIFPL